MSSPRKRSPDGRFMKDGKGLGKIIKDYGNILTSKGKGKKVFNGKNVKKFLKKVLGNRMLDLYLKYIGITTLTTATLVPFGLILSNNYVDRLVNNKKVGGFIPDKLPLIDNPIVGNYLKLAGLSMLNLTPGTLLPLGVVMIIYDLALKNIKVQSGGKITSSLGNSIPPNVFQKIDGLLEGGQGASLFDAFNVLKAPLQKSCDSGACAPSNISAPVGEKSVTVAGLGGASSSVTVPGMTPEQAAAAGAPVASSVTTIPKLMTGGGSDWLSSQYSRGPVNNPTMSEVTLRKFTKTGESIDNSTFAAQNLYGAKAIDFKPIHMKGRNSVLTGVGGGSLNFSMIGGSMTYKRITNPKTGRKVSIYGRTGQNILKNYLNYLKGGK